MSDEDCEGRTCSGERRKAKGKDFRGPKEERIDFLAAGMNERQKLCEKTGWRPRAPQLYKWACNSQKKWRKVEKEGFRKSRFEKR